MNALTGPQHLRFPVSPETAGGKKFSQIDVEYDPATRSVWTFLKPSGTACFNLGILQDLHNNHEFFKKNGGKAWHAGDLCPVDYFVVASRVEHIFNYGGDLALFVLLIKSRDREALLHYARLCIDCIYARIRNYDTNALTISLVQGDALGGGFETALTSNVVIAEESARMGFPEILFNLFPGMGCYSLLARRLGPRKTEEMILSGKIYSAAELHEMGLVDVLVPAGQGEQAVYDFMRQSGKRLNGMRAMYECRHHTFPVSYEELMSITEVWVDAALRLQDKDLKMMGRLVRSQMRQQELRKNGLPVDPDGDCID
ncbi:crotonase/enoyl-CoA hydratase family protein [Noviherbaspirillum massiliense]|uniref:crotonase/enoyl-CoA hydratase family protein n=1 Tax=Noviherbaspirillum massiliense TaxID=1465823 RepID=UPI000378C967|nr:crotonase/enoyl-CoA hydratase family protein [Noviherbaspirillum massiliense]